MSLSRSQLLSLAGSPDTPPATAEAIRRQLAGGGTAPKGGGGVAAFHRIDRTYLGGFRSKAESIYARRLDMEQRAGRVLAWDYEALRFKLADPVIGGRGKWFKTDFLVWHAGGAMSADEVKGAWITDAGRERFRWLCQRFPLLWVRLWKYERGVWSLAMESGRPEGSEADG